MLEKVQRIRLETLNFIEDREVITPYDLMDRFAYTYSYACKKLSLLKKQGLVTILTRGQWILTQAGYRRLSYLCKKYGVLTEREKREWRAYVKEETAKPFEKRRIWWVESDRARMIKEGERGVTLADAKQAVEFNRSMAR